MTLPGKDSRAGKIENVAIDKIARNPYQPRTSFSDDKIGELAQSIRTYGLLQPTIVRRCKNSYQLVAGERRLLACRRLGWKAIPAVVRDIRESAMAAMALIENLQREDLNLIEEAEGYARLLQEFGYTQEALAQRLGKSQPTIANKIRLLRLPPEVKAGIGEGRITERHARALLKLPTEELQKTLYNQAVAQDFTVKQLEQAVSRQIETGSPPAPSPGSKLVIRDLRIFLNTIHQAVKIIEKSGLSPQVLEQDLPEWYEVIIRLPKES